jgi:hypothetical protein
MYTYVRVLMKTGQPRGFRTSGIEWREVSTFERGGGGRSKGPWLVVLGEEGDVVAELLKDAIRGVEIEERVDWDLIRSMEEDEEDEDEEYDEDE